ncbi:transposon Ty3-G Gag-Pol polyprotein [Trichonephila clavipes]|nr:transposon Ty3-G Gag-Pol polyprotein [Trichonephila clavipes]
MAPNCESGVLLKSKGRIVAFTTGSPHTNTIVIAAEIESEFVAKNELVPFRSSPVSSCVALLQTVASMGGRQGQHTLEKAIEIVRAAEASREQIQNMKYNKEIVNFVKKGNQNKPKAQYDCKKCGRKHKPRECPAFGKICTKYKLEKGIESKVNKPTNWVQSLVIVENPDGNLRLCLDPRDLNKVTKREHFQIPCTDDVTSRLEGKKISFVVDLKDGFWHVPLDEVSSEI